MKIVIDIDDETYKQAINRTEFDTLSLGLEVIEAVQNGIPLPKGHGRLIDADKIMRVDHIVLESAIDNAPTIIEADKEGE